MNNLQTHIKNYLEYCVSQKCLDEKALKAYRIDLKQFTEQIPISNITEITSSELVYITPASFLFLISFFVP